MAVEAKMRRWVVRASSRPPPKAREERAVRVGTWRVEMRVRVVRRERRKEEVLVGGRGLARIKIKEIGLELWRKRLVG